MEDINSIAQKIYSTSNLSFDDFEVKNNEIVPSNEYTKSYLLGIIKKMGYNAIVKRGNIILTGEAISEADSGNPVSFAMQIIEELKYCSSKTQAENAWNQLLMQSTAFQQKALSYLISNKEASDVIKMIDNTYETNLSKYLQTEVKEVLHEVEKIDSLTVLDKIKINSETRKLIENMYNIIEETFIQLQEDPSPLSKEIIQSVKAILTQANTIKGKVINVVDNSSSKADF